MDRTLTPSHPNIQTPLLSFRHTARVYVEIINVRFNTTILRLAGLPKMTEPVRTSTWAVHVWGVDLAEKGYIRVLAGPPCRCATGLGWPPAMVGLLSPVNPF